MRSLFILAVIFFCGNSLFAYVPQKRIDSVRDYLAAKIAYEYLKNHPGYFSLSGVEGELAANGLQSPMPIQHLAGLLKKVWLPSACIIYQDRVEAVRIDSNGTVDTVAARLISSFKEITGTFNPPPMLITFDRIEQELHRAVVTYLLKREKESAPTKWYSKPLELWTTACEWVKANIMVVGVACMAILLLSMLLLAAKVRSLTRKVHNQPNQPYAQSDKHLQDKLRMEVTALNQFVAEYRVWHKKEIEAINAEIIDLKKAKSSTATKAVHENWETTKKELTAKFSLLENKVFAALRKTTEELVDRMHYLEKFYQEKVEPKMPPVSEVKSPVTAAVESPGNAEVLFYMSNIVQSVSGGAGHFSERDMVSLYVSGQVLYVFYGIGKPDEAEFEFISDDESIKFVHRDIYIYPACEAENMPDKHTVKVTTLKRGKVQKRGSNWVVIQKSMIRFENLEKNLKPQ